MKEIVTDGLEEYENNEFDRTIEAFFRKQAENAVKKPPTITQKTIDQGDYDWMMRLVRSGNSHVLPELDRT